MAALVATAVLAGAATAGGAAGTTPEWELGTEISTCQTIDESGLYRLGANVTDAPADGCFEVTADDVTLNGNGYTVTTENATGAAVTVRGASDVTVDDLVLEQWRTGVVLLGATERARVVDTTVTNGTAGVRLGGTGDGNAVTDSEFANLTGPAVSVRSANAVVANNVASNVAAGVRVTDTNSVLVEANEISASNASVTLVGVGNVTVRENVVRESEGHAIRVLGEPPEPPTVQQFRLVSLPVAFSQFGAVKFGEQLAANTETAAWDARNHVLDNNVSETSGHGVHVDGTSDAAVRGNTLERNRDGVHVTESTSVTVAANDIVQNRDDGVHLANASANTVANNTVLESGDDGIYSVGSRNVLANNTASRNGDDGIDAQSGTQILVSGNLVANNTNDGVFFRGVVNSTIAENVARKNTDDGIDLHNSKNNLVRANEAYWNGHQAIVVRTDSSNNTVRNNG